jgi:hypothetical protein
VRISGPPAGPSHLRRSEAHRTSVCCLAAALSAVCCLLQLLLIQIQTVTKKQMTSSVAVHMYDTKSTKAVARKKNNVYLRRCPRLDGWLDMAAQMHWVAGTGRLA